MQAVKLRVAGDAGEFCAILGKPGRIYTPYVSLQGKEVRKRKMANGDVERYGRPLLKGGREYPLKRAANHMLRAGRARGITKGAKRLLMEAKQ